MSQTLYKLVFYRIDLIRCPIRTYPAYIQNRSGYVRNRHSKPLNIYTPIITLQVYLTKYNWISLIFSMKHGVFNL